MSAGRPSPVEAGRTRALLGIALLVLVAASAYRLWWTPPPPAVRELSGPSMGTTWSVKLAAPELDAAQRAELDWAVRDVLERIEQLASTYREDSELSRFNRHRSPEPFPASPETLAIFDIARQVGERSRGAFDVTVEPLVRAWGFGAATRAPGPPQPAELEALRELVDYRRVGIDPERGGLTKSDPRVRCDLSAIAKGFAVDALVAELAGRGYRDALVEVGGELRASGRRPDGETWRVAVERPDAAARSAWKVFPLRDAALATSGDYRNFYEHAGRRLSHTIDPRSGRPIDHGLASVSVVHPRAAWADAWATALHVLGPEAGPALAAREGLAAYFIERLPDGSLRACASPAFEALSGGPPEGPAQDSCRPSSPR
ncbi:MAG: FAD:protein FMN transferase [Proteobacteria bacterium]|nr:FAD:protein FMN transferase [Pseudomonadota bacterium]